MTTISRWRRAARGGTILLAALAVGVTALPAQAAPEPASSQEYHDGLDHLTGGNARWMNNVHGNVGLQDMSIPGTHESVSFYGNAYAVTQAWYGSTRASLRKQLNAGIRALDVRIIAEYGNLGGQIVHGAVPQRANLGDDIIGEVRSFLRDNPSETVLLDLKIECDALTGGNFTACTDVGSNVNKLNDFFSRNRDLLWGPASSGNGTAAIPRLDDVRGRLVISRVRGNGGGKYDSFGLQWENDRAFVQDDYCAHPDSKARIVADHLRNTSNAPANYPVMWFNFVNVAPCGASTLFAPYASSKIVNRGVYDHLRDNQNIRKTGVMMFDFPGGGLINVVRSRNALKNRPRPTDPGGQPGGGSWQHGSTHTIKSKWNGQLVDANGDRNGDRVVIYPGNNGANQQWKFWDKGGSTYVLEPSNALGKVLDYNRGGRSVDGTEWFAQLWGVSNSGNEPSNQRWQFESAGGGWFKIKSAADGACLTADAQLKVLGVWQCDGGDKQLWQVS